MNNTEDEDTNQINEEKMRVNLLSSNQLDNFIKNLSNPRFLGSVHMNKKNMQHDKSIENLIKGELEQKVNNLIKYAMFNPITKALILITILFNILWYSLIYLF